MGYNVYLIAALESALGSDFQLCAYPGFDRTVLFPLHLTGPTGYTFNFADASHSRPRRTDAVFWLADRFSIPEATRFALPNARPEAMDLLWYRPPTPQDEPLPTAAMWRGVELVTMRSGWEDDQATYLAAKAGSPGVNHGQADLGSFVLESNGVRWAIDLGPDDYNLPGYFDRAKGRWRYYRNRAEAHSTLLVNPSAEPDQVVDAQCSITKFHGDAAAPFAILDLTEAYQPHVQRLHRGFALLDRRAVLVRDELETHEAAVELWWSMVTRAEIQLRDQGRVAELRQDGQALRAEILQPADGAFSVRPAVPLPKSPHPERQAENSGVSLLTIQLNVPQRLTLSVLLSPGSDPTVDRSRDVPLADW